MKPIITFCISILLMPAAAFSADSVHLVMLSGEKPAFDLNEKEILLPALQKELGEDVVFVKSAYQRAPLRHWCLDWKHPSDAKRMTVDHSQGWAFHELTEKARAAVGDRQVQTVTLLWLQGESDVFGNETVYAENFKGLLDQFHTEFDRSDLNYVIARIAGAKPSSKKQTGWQMIRSTQVELGESSSRAAWIDTDATADRKKAGSVIDRPLAEAAIRLIRSNEPEKLAALPPRTATRHLEPAHLFLLSGQSNMANLDPDEAFTPAVNAAFGKEHVIVVKAAYGAKSISHWYRPSQKADTRNWLHTELVGKTRFRIADREIKSVTLVWMQGENNAAKTSGTYAECFLGMLQNLREDLGRDDLNFVIGRLSDHSNPKKYPEWEAMRTIQVELAESSLHGSWIDTDDLNGEDDNLHYPSGESGRVGLGERFAEQAIELARKTAP